MSGIENFFPSRFLQSKEKNYVKGSEMPEGEKYWGASSRDILYLKWEHIYCKNVKTKRILVLSSQSNNFLFSRSLYPLKHVI